MKTLKLSAVIITLNEADKIRGCIRSVDFCDEILIVDSGSTDNTAAIASDLGARVIQQDWLGYGPQKQFAVNQAKNDWVLCLDADEIISQELRHSITALNMDTTIASGFKMPRRNHFLGKALKHGEGYPDYSLRLFNKNAGQWSNDKVHEGVKITGDIEKITGDLLHFSADDITTYLHKQNRYTQLQAKAMYSSGKRCSPMKCFSSPLLRFIKFYFLRRGFMDGLPGFIHISIGCFNAFAKYAKLIELQKSSGQ